MHLALRRLGGAVPVAVLLLPALAQAPIPRLTEAQQATAARLMESIRKDPRGPYGSIQWYCKDGRVLSVRDRCGGEGGFQHAAPSPAATRLAAFHLDVARFLAGMPAAQFIDAGRNHFWLRQMIMLDFLVTRENGWIYAKTYARRGVAQVEDEEREGRRLLIELFATPGWLERNYLLAMLVASVTPHGLESGALKEIRALAARLGDLEPAFQPVRGKIHSRPEPSDTALVEAYLRKRQGAPNPDFDRLLELMKQQNDSPSPAPGFDFAGGAARSLAIRQSLVSDSLTPARRLDLVDEQLRLQRAAIQHGSRPEGDMTRRQRLDEIGLLVRYATGAGLISLRQYDALQESLKRLLAQPQLPVPQYRQGVDYLEGAGEWARAAVEREVSEAEVLYTAIEPRAIELGDEVLRGSVILPLAQKIEALAREADTLSGRNHRIFSLQGRRGIRALNPGIARGQLDIIDPGEVPDIDPARIYIIPATLAELRPMKGIITLDSGNALSHAQLLAASLGVPNATLPSSLLPQLRAHIGVEILYAVTPGGTVVLRSWSSLNPDEQAFWKRSGGSRVRVSLPTSRVRLDDRRLRTLDETTSADSGVRSGPKAANLGQLRRLFPTRVAPGIVIPFGVYYAHASRRNASGQSIDSLVRALVADSETRRLHGAPEDEIIKAAAPRLAAIRKAIAEIQLDPGFVSELATLSASTFGPDGSYGVFVRSDTNVEDLPQFTGAGLNLTVNNVVGSAHVLSALKRVWASPFEERAFAWRFAALEGTHAVYPSVVLLKTVPSDKSGVMATANLATLDFGDLTVNANEGVAAVVDGGVSESLLLRSSGEVVLLAQARSAYCKRPLPSGGIGEAPTSNADYVLSAAEIAQLRELAREVRARLPAARDETGQELPGDIEFGFEKGDLRLFQIRPLVRYREARGLEALATLESVKSGKSSVLLDEKLIKSDDE